MKCHYLLEIVTMKSCPGACPDLEEQARRPSAASEQEDGTPHTPHSFNSRGDSPAFITVQDDKGNLEQIPVRYYIYMYIYILTMSNLPPVCLSV